MSFNQIKTFILLSATAGLLVATGRLIGGNQGALFAFGIAVVINLFAYFFSDKMVLKFYNAVPLPEEKYKKVYDIVQELSLCAEIPMPKLYLVQANIPNAFATGRGPGNASIAVTSGILETLDLEELRAVLAHELSHVKNRDILVATIAATLVAAVGMLVDWARWALFWRSSSDNQKGSTMGTIFVIIFFPFVTLLMQMAISRTREYMADDSGAKLCGEPLALASALRKISANNGKIENPSCAERACSALFICNPFKGEGLIEMFSTHPLPKNRIARLEKMAQNNR